MNDWVTFAQAAAILGCPVSNIPKLIAKGSLRVRRDPGRVRGRVQRADVLRLAEFRAAAAASPKAYVRPQKPDRRPDAKHDWLTPEQAGRVVGITAQGSHQRTRPEILPAVQHQGRWWIRRHHLELVHHAHMATRTRRP